uniref:Uncharacterized protein n=1 Tax=Avena sativa TaxID=4498 RepID=A0ACD5Y416_AVESA
MNYSSSLNMIECIFQWICIQKVLQHIEKALQCTPKGSPKYNLMQSKTMGKKLMKKTSPKASNRDASPRDGKRRASWNRGLEKALVEILLEHNNTYHRSQNGWSSDTWNIMVGIFNSKYTHVHFTKTQIQNKEKDLKRDYRMLRDARKQSGVGCNEHRCMIQAEPHLWDNLEVSFGNKIRKFRTEDSRFPLYDLLGEIYESQIAEGDFNFTSMAEPPRRDDVNNIESDGEFEDERELEKEEAAVQQTDDELQMLDQAETRGVGGAKTRPKKIPKKPKRSPKKSSGDALVGVMQRFVEINEKESKKEEVADFSITRCMIELKALEGVTPDLKVKRYGIFKCPKN